MNCCRPGLSGAVLIFARMEMLSLSDAATGKIWQGKEKTVGFPVNNR